MKVLLISHFFPPGYTAGTETYTLALAKALTAYAKSAGIPLDDQLVPVTRQRRLP